MSFQRETSNQGQCLLLQCTLRQFVWLWILYESAISDVKAHPSHFGYSINSQKDWHHHSTSCSGRHQSPIEIDTKKAIPIGIPALEFVGFHNLIPRPVSITNNGHSVELKPALHGKKYGKIYGALLNGIYGVEGIHFHWGRSNDKGSEHVINSVRFAMEMHIVTRNKKYETIEKALNHSDGLAVLATFFHVRERESSSLQPILDDLDMVQPDGSSAYLSHSFTLASLLPRDTDIFYTYRGSLTTPPCSEAVTWIIFPDPLPVSYAQVNKFRQLSSGHEAMVDNFRHLQKLGKRKIFVRRQPIEFQIHRNIFRDSNSIDFWGDTVDSYNENEASDLEND